MSTYLNLGILYINAFWGFLITQVNAYRKMLLEKENLLGKGDGDGSDGDGEEQLDEFGRVIVKDSHQFAKLQHQVRR